MWQAPRGEPGDMTPAASCPGSAWTAFRSSKDDAGSTRGPLWTRETPLSLPVQVLSGSVSRAWNTHTADLTQLPAPPDELRLRGARPHRTRCQHRCLGLRKPPVNREAGGRAQVLSGAGRGRPYLWNVQDLTGHLQPPLHTRIKSLLSSRARG